MGCGSAARQESQRDMSREQRGSQRVRVSAEGYGLQPVHKLNKMIWGFSPRGKYLLKLVRYRVTERSASLERVEDYQLDSCHPRHTPNIHQFAIAQCRANLILAGFTSAADRGCRRRTFPSPQGLEQASRALLG